MIYEVEHNKSSSPTQ